MDALQKVFNYKGNQIRTVVKDREPWWVAKDVCYVLELGNVGQALSRLDEDEKDTIILNDGTPGNPTTAIVNEPGLYVLILSSRKPEAKAFKRWITHEVIPSIRKTGQYSAPKSQAELMLMMAQQLVEQEKRMKAIDEKAQAAHHRINNLDAINTIGDPQQRLNAMVRKYAHQNGLTFSRAWHDFIQAYNTACRTNLKLLQANYEMNKGRKVTTPQYLAASGKLEDGIRVADKMLNVNQAII